MRITRLSNGFLSCRSQLQEAGQLCGAKALQIKFAKMCAYGIHEKKNVRENRDLLRQLFINKGYECRQDLAGNWSNQILEKMLRG